MGVKVTKAILVAGGGEDPNQLAERLSLYNEDGSPFTGGGGVQWGIVGNSTAVDQANGSIETDIPFSPDGPPSYVSGLPDGWTYGDLAIPSEPGLFMSSLTVAPWWPEENPPVSGQLGAAIVFEYQNESEALIQGDLIRVTFSTDPGTDGGLVTPGDGFTKFNIWGLQDDFAGNVYLRVYQNAFADPVTFGVDFAIVKLA
jgi:hypothetical protein